MANVLIFKIAIICTMFYIFNQIYFRVITLLNKNRIMDYVKKYSDCCWSFVLSRSLCEPMFFRFFIAFNPGGIASLIVKTFIVAKENKIGILKALFIQASFDTFLLIVTERNFRWVHKEIVRIIGSK